MEESRQSVAVTELVDGDVEELYEHAPCGHLSLLPDGTIVRVNQTFLSWTAHARADLVGRARFHDLLTAGGRIFYETHLSPLLQMQEHVREIALEIVCADGRRLPVLVNAALKKDPRGSPMLTRLAVFTAADRRTYERELLLARQRAEQADATKAAFISMMSHEIRNALNTIVGAERLLATTDLSPDQRRLVRILRSSSENLLNLLNHVLEMGRAASGKLALEKRSFDLRQLVEGSVSAVRLAAEDKGLALDAAIDDDLPASLSGDPVKIAQVLANLLGNAVKFTAEGRVFLTVRPVETGGQTVAVEFRVTDTGIGIPADRLPHIFEEFTQASADVARRYGGTGLGLAISRRLVELHGGRLEVESEPGRGSTFWFVLRLEVAPAV